VRHLAAGDRLLTTGHRNRSMFFVVEGAADVLLHGIDAPLARLGAGECIGELSLIDGQPVSADVVAAAPTVVLEVSHAHVWSIIDRSAAFARNLLRVLARRVRHDHAVLAQSTGERRRFEHLSMIDGLTGLHNRRWLDAVFPGCVTRWHQEGRPGALLMADLDRFKRLNDDHGHAAGDEALRRIATAFSAAVRPTDQLARYGGEEFAVLITDTSEEDALAVAERLRRAAAATSLAGMPACSVSVGVAVMQPDEAYETLVRRADAALFRAKKAGRDCVSM
jgi:diguanylate cyclase (GGDEF)-like protein